MAIEVTRALLDRVLAEAAAAHPRECCGLLLGRGTSVTEARPCANVHPHPERHFEIDPRALIQAHRASRAGGAIVLGYYHSHPGGPAEPSATDRALAASDGSIWLIAGESDIAAFRAIPARGGLCAFEPVRLVVRN